MEVECVFFGPLRDAVGEKTIRFDTDVETVGELLSQLELDYPALEGQLVEDGDVIETLAVTLNTRHVVHLEDGDTPLADGDVIRLTPPVYGG